MGIETRESEKGLKFSELLTEAIYAIKRKEGKKISIIQDELTYAIGREQGNPIEYWRKGNLPPAPIEFKLLSKELVSRGQLNEAWLFDFWSCVDFEGFKETSFELFEQKTSEVELPIHSSTLLGREEQLDKIFSCFDSNLTKIVAIDGMGGIGKTALAQEVIHRARQNNQFEAVYWITDNITNQEDILFNSDFIFNDLCNKMGIPNASTISAENKIARIKTTLKSQKAIVVLDNLERLVDSQELIVAQFIELLGEESKALILSRKRFTKDVFHIHLQGLSNQHSKKMLKSEAKSRGVHQLEEATEENFLEIATKCGGSPLALKLVIGQLGYQSLPIVLERLQNVEFHNTTDLDEYGRFYRNIFIPSWRLLSRKSKTVLISMSHFSSGHGGTFEAVKATCGLSTNQTAHCIDELWGLAFVEIGDAALNQLRYYLHALTQYFILSDVTNTIGVHQHTN